MDASTAESPVAFYGLDPRGFLYVRMKDGSLDTLETAKTNVEILRALGKNKAYPLLVDVSGSTTLSSEARQYYIDTTPSFATRMAIHARSVVTRVIGNFFIGAKGAGGNTVPTRLFSDEARAILWLLTG